MNDIRWLFGYLYGVSSVKARLFTVLTLITSFGVVGLRVSISYAEKSFSTSLSQKDVDGFYYSVIHFFGVIVVAVPLFAAFEWLQLRLSLEFRLCITREIVRLYTLQKKCYEIKHVAGIDNVDQRICEDVRNSMTTFVTLGIKVFEKVMTIFSFTGILWSISPNLVWFLTVYSAVGTFIMVWFIGSRIRQRQAIVVKTEADLRHAMMRIGENAESIAFYKGEHLEKEFILQHLVRLEQALIDLALWRRHTEGFSNTYYFITILLPSIIVAPQYFEGKIEFGSISQAGMVFHNIMAAVSLFVTRFSDFSMLMVEVKRLRDLHDQLFENKGQDVADNNNSSNNIGLDDNNNNNNDGSEMALISPSSSSLSSSLSSRSIRYRNKNRIQISNELDNDDKIMKVMNLTVFTPKTLAADVEEDFQMHNKALFHALNFEIGTKDKLLIMGPSACGKSSLLRVIAGLWDIGFGRIIRPATSQIFFIPQHPYTCPGSFRDQFLYPDFEHHTISDSDILHVIQAVGLEKILTRVTQGLSSVEDWDEMLSIGEQQRVAFARVLLQKPLMVILDEATSAMDLDNEQLCYSLLQQYGISCWISVGHRESLTKYHTHKLQFTKDKTATIEIIR